MHALVLIIINLHNKFEVPLFTHVLCACLVFYVDECVYVSLIQPLAAI